MIVNGREYPLWGQFVERKAEWIGGLLIDNEPDSVGETEINDITLEPNGDDSAMLTVGGKDFFCAFDVKTGGIGGEAREGEIRFQTTWGGDFTIRREDRP